MQCMEKPGGECCVLGAMNSMQLFRTQRLWCVGVEEEITGNLAPGKSHLY